MTLALGGSISFPIQSLQVMKLENPLTCFYLPFRKDHSPTFTVFDIFLRPRTLWTSSGRRHMAWSSNNSLGRHLGGWRVTRLSKKNQQQSTLEPQQPMKHAGFKILNPQYMGEITPKNEGNVGSHGRWYFPVDIQANTSWGERCLDGIFLGSK